MVTHRFVYIDRAGARASEGLEFRNNAMAVTCARSLLSVETISVAVRRVDRGNVERVCLWIWNRGAPEWKPDE